MLQTVFHVVGGVDEEEAAEAVTEAEEAVERVLLEGTPVELSPRRSSLRKLQHLVASRHHLPAESVGREPARRLVIHPG
jgi:predicted RNA-binding protein Jag